MAVFRVEKNRNYTVMCNYHLRDTNLSLKAIGLLSKMLSLSDEWDYTARGLASICKEGVDAIAAALRELERCGYLVRRQLRDAKGRISDTEYTIYETPQTSSPSVTQPHTENPHMDEPYPIQTAQLNIDISNTESLNTDLSNPYPSNTEKATGYDGMGGVNGLDYAETLETVKLNIDYEALSCEPNQDMERLDGIVGLIAETLCSNRQSIVIAGGEYPMPLVRERFMKLNSSHIEYVLDCMDNNTSRINNIKKYLLAALFNAPLTKGSYYGALANHELYGGGRKPV